MVSIYPSAVVATIMPLVCDCCYYYDMNCLPACLPACLLACLSFRGTYNSCLNHALYCFRPPTQFFDTDSDGFLTPEQTEHAFVQLGFPGDAMVTSLLDFPDFCECVGVAMRRAFEKDELDARLRHSFRLMDRDQNRSLATSDLVRYLKSVGLAVTVEQAERINELICDEDEIKFNEDNFVAFLSTQIELNS